MDESRQESEARLRALEEQSPNMIFINQKGKVIYANQKCEAVMGYKRDGFYSPKFDFLTLIAPEDRELVQSNFRRYMKGEHVEPYEYTIITKDGKRIDVILSTSLISSERERSILGILTDITEHKRVEEELKKVTRTVT
jgi:PAS domain S-box-containing protein